MKLKRRRNMILLFATRFEIDNEYLKIHYVDQYYLK